MNGKLIVADGDRERIHEILEPITVIGRGSGVDLHVRDPAASAIHCEIRLTPHGFKLVDLESKTGTRLNGRFVNQEMLRHGDEIGIGQTTITYSGESATEPPAVQAKPQVLNQIPTDEHGEPRRFYRHEAGRHGGAGGGSPSAVVLISVVLAGFGVLVGWLVIRANRQTESTERLTQIRQLLREAHTERDFKEARAQLDQLNREFVEAADIEALDQRIKAGMQQLRDAAERARILNTTNPQATWDELRQRVTAAIASRNFAEAYRVIRVVEESNALWKVGGTAIPELHRKLDEAFTPYARDRLKRALEMVQRRDNNGAVAIYDEIESVGADPYSTDARRALDQLRRKSP